MRRINLNQSEKLFNNSISNAGILPVVASGFQPDVEGANAARTLIKRVALPASLLAADNRLEAGVT